MARILGDDFDNDPGGTAGHDRIFGGLGDDTLNGDTKHDRLYGGRGYEGLLTLYGGTGTDHIRVGRRSDLGLTPQYQKAFSTDGV